ncbi:MAG: DsbA family protein [Gammaproteobacteria bacterium]|nr:DsbA family protein [Gammaproteobacteria bacterium]
MCSWCYAFAPSWRALVEDCGRSVALRYVMGGWRPTATCPCPSPCAPPSPIPRAIERRTGADFNHDFWRLNEPRRSTWPACRAVIAAALVREGAGPEMIEAIQRAYYREARNPSLDEVLIDIAESIGLDRGRFADEFHGDEVRRDFAADLALTRNLGVAGFPAVFALREGGGDDGALVPVTLGYRAPHDVVAAGREALVRLGLATGSLISHRPQPVPRARPIPYPTIPEPEAVPAAVPQGPKVR